MYYISRRGDRMPVPEEIRRVDRPTNTIVVDTGSKGAKRYAVRERSGVKYVAGGNPQPVNGKIIGYIVDFVFTPKVAPLARVPECSAYGTAALIRDSSIDLFHQLLQTFDPNDATDIIVVASLKVMLPDLPNSRMRGQYERTFLRIFYPGAKLSENTVEHLYEHLGMDRQRRLNFYELRAASVCESEHVIIDGMLKQDTSIVNNLSQASRKSRVRGVKDISIVYAYNLERLEPICCKVYQGNEPDISAYRSFVLDNNIQAGIITADKAFALSKIRDLLADRPELHFITPLKSNDTRITANKMLEFQGQLANVSHNVLYAKKQIRGGHFLYSFQDTTIEANQNNAYLKRNKKGKHKKLDGEDSEDTEAVASAKGQKGQNSNQSQSPDNDETINLDYNKYKGKKENFGVIVLESDLDLPPQTVYRSFKDRWEIELFFRQYKNDINLNETREQYDYRVIGAEFVNYISAIISCRINRKFTEAGLLKNCSYAALMNELNNAFRIADSPMPPTRSDGYWVSGLNIDFDLMEKVGVIQEEPKPTPKKRGRPPKDSKK